MDKLLFNIQSKNNYISSANPADSKNMKIEMLKAQIKIKVGLKTRIMKIIVEQRWRKEEFEKAE